MDKNKKKINENESKNETENEKINETKINKKEMNENKKDNKNKINVIESIKINYLCWIFIIISIFVVSHQSIISGVVTFFICFLLSYWSHYFIHKEKNIFSILHHYHHENDNFFSHFTAILLELLIIDVVIILYYLFNVFLNIQIIDIWTGILYTLFYSSVHNYNYGQLKVNNVHHEHHINMFTNIGPDICDIAFGTKNKNDTEVENTNHCIPNIILSTIFILFIQYLCIDESVRDCLLKIFSLIMLLIFLFISISSIYLYINLK